MPQQADTFPFSKQGTCILKTEYPSDGICLPGKHAKTKERAKAGDTPGRSPGRNDIGNNERLQINSQVPRGV